MTPEDQQQRAWHGSRRRAQSENLMTGQNAMPVTMSESRGCPLGNLLGLSLVWIKKFLRLDSQRAQICLKKIARPDNDDLVVPKIAPIIGPSFPLSSLFRMVEIPGGRVR